MTETEKLLAIEEIKLLKARYWYYTDTKNWKAFVELFAPDLEFDHSKTFTAVDPVSGASRVFGRPELLAAIDTSTWKMTSREELIASSNAFADIVTVHQGFNPQIAIHSCDDASGIWSMQDMLRFPPGGPITEIRGYGHYHETYKRLDGRWVIKTSTLKRLRIDVC